MSKRIQYTVEGRVQGVGFRAFTAKQASGLSLTGHVKNESNGTVTGEAQGSNDSLQKFIQHLNKGPSMSSVSKVDTKEISVKQGESGFSE